MATLRCGNDRPSPMKPPMPSRSSSGRSSWAARFPSWSCPRTDPGRPSSPSTDRMSFSTFPQRWREDLRSLGAREGCTLFMTLLAAFQVLLQRYSGAEDIVIGTPVAARTVSRSRAADREFSQHGGLALRPFGRSDLHRIAATEPGHDARRLFQQRPAVRSLDETPEV